jgi:hypothetical protein
VLISGKLLRQDQFLFYPQPQLSHQALQLNHFQRTIQPVMAPAHNQIGPCQRMAMEKKIPALVLKFNLYQLAPVPLYPA